MPWTEEEIEEMEKELTPATVICYGFKSRIQLPWFMIWREYHILDEVVHAEVLFQIGK